MVIPIPALHDNYIWILLHSDQTSITCVDPGDADPVLRWIKEQRCVLKNILITHHHADHIGGVEALLAQSSATVYAPEDICIPWATRRVFDQETIEIDVYQFSVLAIPGHTRSHVAYYEPNRHWLFCGDTLFSAGCGRVFDGTVEQLYHSVQRIKQLPDQTKLYCAHEYTLKNLAFAQSIEPENKDIHKYIQEVVHQSCSLPSTLGLEKKINPFLRTDRVELSGYAQAQGIQPGDSLGLFRKLRDAKDTW